MPEKLNLSEMPAARPEVITFRCDGCGAALRVAREQAGVRGPCPVCGESVGAPTGAEDGRVRVARQPPRAGRLESRRGRVMPDSMVDHGEIDRRESVETLRLLAAVILVICVCLAVAWFLLRSASG